jgi:catechol 2,3-dioxygenase-like lactoylglutathione lyase family enzyme
MEPRVSFVTLGVASIVRARAFYDKLGFKASSASNAEVVFYDAGGIVLALFGRHALADDAKIESAGSGFSGVALAHNVRSEAEADEALRQVEAAGGRIVKPAQRTFWGGYAGYFADPDGHLWEVAHNPGFPLDSAGRVTLPPPNS